MLATAHGEAGLRAAREAGADHVFDYAAEDLPQQILDATGGALVDRIVEVEFGRNAATNAQVIAEGGTISAYGSAKEMTPVMPFYPLMFKAVTIDLVLVYILGEAERARMTHALTEMLERKALMIRIAAELDLTDCAKAHDIVAAGKRAGAVILKV